SSEASNGRQVIRSPAEPPSRRELSAALYSVGAVGLNTTWMSGWAFSKAGMIVFVHRSASSFPQLAMVSVVAARAALLIAAIATAAEAERTSRFIPVSFIISTLPVAFFSRRGGRRHPFLPPLEPGEGCPQISLRRRQQASCLGGGDALEDQRRVLDAAVALMERGVGGGGRRPGDMDQRRHRALAELLVVDPEVHH